MTRPKTVAIIGAGFCGLAVAWHLLNARPNLTVKIFDPKPLGSGASGIAAGLLHPFVGAKANLNWRGKEGVEATLKLLAIAEEALGAPVYSPNKGVLRLAITQEQVDNFSKCALKNPEETTWLSDEECLGLIPSLTPAPGLLIKNGLSVYTKFYLEGLWKACQMLGANWIPRPIASLYEAENEGDVVIFTTGAYSQNIEGLAPLPLKGVKGQLLQLIWPEHLPPLPCAISSQGYIVMAPDQKTCFVGSTYEKNFKDGEPDWQIASGEIFPKASSIIPELKEARIQHVYAGIRSVGPGHLPYLEQLSDRAWILAGMGSKGLLYHALYANVLIKKLPIDCK
jgi:glycine/D-amino acid oxidase-like deaminating enzyme